SDCGRSTIVSCQWVMTASWRLPLPGRSPPAAQGSNPPQDSRAKPGNPLSFHAGRLKGSKTLPDSVPMTPQKLIIWITSLTGGAVGLLAPVCVVKWLLQTEPEDAGMLTFFF